MSIELFFDGSAKPSNPGPSGGGYVIKFKTSGHNYSGCKATGFQTNNYAEYTGLIVGLESLIAKGYANKEIIVKGDSALVINQLGSGWKVNSSNLIPLWTRAKKLVEQFDNIKFVKVSRHENIEADAMANQASDLSKAELDLL